MLLLRSVKNTQFPGARSPWRLNYLFMVATHISVSSAMVLTHNLLEVLVILLNIFASLVVWRWKTENTSGCPYMGYFYLIN
jgi:hypothetical protein